ncbi:acyltransferase 3 [Thermaerobacter marianensis DSM 12885]|uniref:Acyltransferase 3 n=1 Tax=Thermaerobacter marianensis (strain ATCC 700841 / DSM 12885 / JCM 10246 / 7p75a) TaxID=644966 RepID=E6SJJ7_THEM7|nr:acyltransferase 3 [Thermaerobacter marianensis DSM 12885]
MQGKTTTPAATGPHGAWTGSPRATPGRLAALDVARGLSISLVVLGHTPLPAWLNGPLTTVRLPLLFFISGYLFNWERYRHRPGRLAWERARRLLLPYVTAGLATFLFWLVARRPVDPAAQAVPWYRPLLGWLYGSSSDEWMVFNLPLWFLPASFWGQVIFWGLLRAVGHRSFAVQAAVAVAAGLGGAGLGRWAHLPWSVDVALATQPFFWVGWFVRQRVGLRLPATAWLAGTALWLAALGMNGPVAVNARAYGQPLWFYAGGLGACLLALRLAAALAAWHPARAVLGFLGRHSMVVLAFHVGLAFPVLAHLLQWWLGDALLGAWGLYWLWGLAMTAGLGWIVERSPWLATLLEGVPVPARTAKAERVPPRPAEQVTA